MKTYRNTVLFNMRLNRIILVIFAILTIFSVFLVREKLINNAKEIGNYLAWNYATEEQNNITIYQTFVKLGAESIDQKLNEGADVDKIHDMLEDLFKNISETLNNSNINLYAIVDGNVISANPALPLDDFDYESKQWYQDTIKADGEIVFTDVYTDSITGELIFTVSKKCEQSDNVLMFDVFIDYYHTNSDTINLPLGGSYFLCDKTGNPLYYSSNIDLSYEQANEYSKRLLEYIKSDNSKKTFNDINGDAQGVYYYKMPNGWISILTIPLDAILDNLHRFVLVFSFVFLIFFAIIIFMTIRDHHMHRKVSHITDTVQVLGDSYYAIYRINYNMGIYEAIKLAPDVTNIMNPEGTYDNFLNIMCSLVEKSVYEDFKESFSLKNIIKLVNENITDYGGYYLRKFNNVYKWVHIRMIVDKNVLPNEVVLCFREVDSEKKNQLEHVKLLESALESAKENEESKNAFFNSMSHDMRTPLNVILNLSNLVEENISNPNKVLDYIKKIKFSSNQLLTLINDLLEISRLERTNISFSNEPLDLEKCIQDCANSFIEIAHTENKTFNISFDITNKMIMGDSTRINQIVNNLLSNAFKYSESGDTISITLREYQENKNFYYQIIVSDTGIGISKEFLDHIFDSYARETRFSSRNITGTGLGMPIVHRLVHQMGGEISVESKIGIGSIFTVTLPFKILDKSNKVNNKDKILSNIEPELVNLSGKKILLVEDNEINLEITTEILKMEGMEVFPATNGREAVELFSKHNENFFDAILMDMLMPEMDGCEAAKAIRNLNRADAKTIPIIAVTANAFAEDIAKTTEAGMNAHISKPIDFNILCQTLKSLIKK